jgi:hypothetical protein
VRLVNTYLYSAWRRRGAGGDGAAGERSQEKLGDAMASWAKGGAGEYLPEIRST